jgi:hypothetical protein
MRENEIFPFKDYEHNLKRKIFEIFYLCMVLYDDPILPYKIQICKGKYRLQFLSIGNFAGTKDTFDFPLLVYMILADKLKHTFLEKLVQENHNIILKNDVKHLGEGVTIKQDTLSKHVPLKIRPEQLSIYLTISCKF